MYIYDYEACVSYITYYVYNFIYKRCTRDKKLKCLMRWFVTQRYVD